MHAPPMHGTPGRGICSKDCPKEGQQPAPDAVASSATSRLVGTALPSGFLNRSRQRELSPTVMLAWKTDSAVVEWNFQAGAWLL